MHEGGERALYAVIAGKIEVVKLVDGIERTLGWRIPGAIFGEVPLTLGTPFPGAYRASEPSRVMRIDAQQYYAVAATAPDISLKVSALARERIGGLQGIAAEAPKPRVTMFGHRWDSACTDLRRFLARNQITYEWVTPDSPDAREAWPAEAAADADCPVLRLSDGTMISSPERARPCRASRAADSATSANTTRDHRWRTCRTRGSRVRSVRRSAHPGRRARGARRPGRDVLSHRELSRFPSGVSGDELASRALQQARRLGAEILVTRSVSRIDPVTRRSFSMATKWSVREPSCWRAASLGAAWPSTGSTA